jgi:hypothetical protein
MSIEQGEWLQKALGRSHISDGFSSSTTPLWGILWVDCGGVGLDLDLWGEA